MQLTKVGRRYLYFTSTDLRTCRLERSTHLQAVERPR